jgi:hypothetical protein
MKGFQIKAYLHATEGVRAAWPSEMSAAKMAAARKKKSAP